MPVFKHKAQSEVQAVLKTMHVYSEQFVKYEEELQRYIKRAKVATEDLARSDDTFKKSLDQVEMRLDEIDRVRKEEAMGGMEKLEKLAELGTTIDARVMVEAL